MQDGNVIEIRDLWKTYARGLFRPAVQALAGVSFDVRRGEIFGLLGPNGAGKTTVIKVLLGISRRTRGSAKLFSYKAGDRRGRKRVGYLPENLRLPRHQTANTALEFYGKLSGLSLGDVRNKRDRLLEIVGLAGRDRESVRRYSKGMLQRLGLAQALLHDPELLILDEPTDGLDPVGRSNVRSMLQELRNEGRTVLINSHLLQEVELVCDRVAILDKGHLRSVGTIDELTPNNQSELEMVLTGPVDQIENQLQSHGVTNTVQLAGHNVAVTVSVKDQAAIDALVDDLRRAGISIVHLSAKKRTLEDAFLQLVAAEATVL